MKLTPEMIDAAVIQLQSLFETSTDVPEKVRETGKAFVASLDEWSTEMKGAKTSNAGINAGTPSDK